MRPLSPKSAPTSSSAYASANPEITSPQSSRDVISADHDYAVMEELDEENINWGRLCTRVCSIFLLVVIIILVSKGVLRRVYFTRVLCLMIVCPLAGWNRRVIPTAVLLGNHRLGHIGGYIWL
jgi:hypothetical protein